MVGMEEGGTIRQKECIYYFENISIYLSIYLPMYLSICLPTFAGYSKTVSHGSMTVIFFEGVVTDTKRI